MLNLRALIVTVTTLLLGVVTFYLYLGLGLTEDSIGWYIRFTAGSSVLLFALAWSASSLNTLMPAGRWQPVLRARRRIGISFAISHTFHLLGIWLLVEVVFGGDWTQMEVVSGGVIYAAIYLMAFTSNDASLRALGAKRWKWLHRIGGYLIWIAFTYSYVGNAVEVGALQHYVYTAILLALPVLRLVAGFSRQRPRSDEVATLP